jgi:cell division protease FtsH
MKLAPTVDLSVVARMTPGFAGADLANALNEAALLAARQNKGAVELIDIEAAIERIVAGLEKKSRRLSDQERRVVAFHEAGHAICAASSPGADPVQKISIIPRGIGALGYTLQTPLEDRYLMSRDELSGRLVVLYGGRTAEEICFGDFTTGASDDIRRASDLARRMVTQFGMSEALGPVDYGGERPNPLGLPGGGREIAVSEETARQIDTEVRRLLDAAHTRATQILGQHRGLLQRMAERLLEKEVLDRDELASFLAEAQSSSGFAVVTPGASAPRASDTGTATVAEV